MPAPDIATLSHTEQPDLSEVELAAVLHALADPVRLEIVRQVAGCTVEQTITCGELELPVSSRPAATT